MCQVLDDVGLYAGHVLLAPQEPQRLRIRGRVRVRVHDEQGQPRRRAVLDQPRGRALLGQGRVLLQQLAQVAGARVRPGNVVALDGSSRTETVGLAQVQQGGAVAAGGPAHHAPAPAVRGDAQRSGGPVPDILVEPGEGLRAPGVLGATGAVAPRGWRWTKRCTRPGTAVMSGARKVLLWCSGAERCSRAERRRDKTIRASNAYWRVIVTEVGEMGVVAACHDQASSLRARVQVRSPTVTAVMPSASACATTQEPAAQASWLSWPATVQ